MTYINLKDFDLQIENPIDKDVLELLLQNLQYRYDNPKSRDNTWNINENGFRLTLDIRTNCNGKYVAIIFWQEPDKFVQIFQFSAMVKVYDKEQKIRVIADPYMVNMYPEFKNVVLKLLDYRRPNREK